MIKCFSVVKTAIKIDAMFKKHGIELPESEAVNLTMLIKTLRIKEDNASETEMKFISENIAYKVAVTNYTSYEVTALIVTRVEDNVRVFAEMINHQFNDDGQEYKPLVEEPVKENLRDKIKNIYHGVRMRKLCDAVKTTKTPMEAYALLLDFLGDSGEISGTIAKKEMVMDYHFENNQENKTVSVSINARTKGGDRLIELDINLSEANIETFDMGMLSLTNLFR